MQLFLKIRNRLLILVHNKFLLSQNCAAEFKIEYKIKFSPKVFYTTFGLNFICYCGPALFICLTYIRPIFIRNRQLNDTMHFYRKKRFILPEPTFFLLGLFATLAINIGPRLILCNHFIDSSPIGQAAKITVVDK